MTTLDIKGLLEECESFISGFEGDETQEEPVDGLLERLREAIASPRATLGIVISGGALQAVISDYPEAAVAAIEGVVLIDYDNGGQADDDDPDVFDIRQTPGDPEDTERAQVVDFSIGRDDIRFADLLRDMATRDKEQDDGKPSA